MMLYQPKISILVEMPEYRTLFKKKSAARSLLRLVGLLIMKVTVNVTVTMMTLQNGMTTFSSRWDCTCGVFVQLGEELCEARYHLATDI